MGIDAKYRVDFSGYRKDLDAEAKSRLLSQFRDAPVINQVLAAYVARYQELHDAIVDLMEARTLYGARGAFQDGLGRIVGRNRSMYSSTDPTATANDDQYQELLLNKVFKNMSKFGSVPELKKYILDAFGTNCYIARTGPMSVTIYVPSGTSDFVIDQLSHATTLPTWDEAFEVPYPATLDVTVEVMDPSLFYIDINAILNTAVLA